MLAGGFGLSSAMFTGIYSLFFSDMDSVAPFILFMAISIASVALLGGLMLKLVLQHLLVLIMSATLPRTSTRRKDTQRREVTFVANTKRT